MHRFVTTIALVGSAAALMTGPASVSATTKVVAVGDIACAPSVVPTSETCRDAAVAKRIARLHPKSLWLLGDIQYPNGSLADFKGGFGRSWERFRDIWHPAPGNHEYDTPRAAGYFDFFGDAAGYERTGFYALDVGRWHVVSLNTNCDRVSCGFWSDQGRWLREDLKANRNRCTAAILHHPLVSSGEHGANPVVGKLWKELRKAKVDIALSGHDHHYERLAQIDELGRASKTGPRSFIVGTGGKSEYDVGAQVPNSEYVLERVFGALELSLGTRSYRWRFVTEGGNVFDRGRARCR